MVQQPLCYDDIATACGRLQNRGQRPSLRLVRSEIGRGSMTTIHEHVSRWNAEQSVEQRPQHESLRALEALAPSAVPALRDAFRAEVAQDLKLSQDDAQAQRLMAAELHDALGESERLRSELAERLQAMEQRVRAVEGLVDRVAALAPELAGRLEAHTDHLLAAADAHAQQAVQDQRQAVLGLQQLTNAVRGLVATQREQGEALRRLDDEIRLQGHAAFDQAERLAIACADATHASERRGRQLDTRIDRLHGKQGLMETLMRKTLASARRSSQAG